MTVGGFKADHARGGSIGARSVPRVDDPDILTLGGGTRDSGRGRIIPCVDNSRAGNRRHEYKKGVKCGYKLTAGPRFERLERLAILSLLLNCAQVPIYGYPYHLDPWAFTSHKILQVI